MSNRTHRELTPVATMSNEEQTGRKRYFQSAENCPPKSYPIRITFKKNSEINAVLSTTYQY